MDFKTNVQSSHALTAWLNVLKYMYFVYHTIFEE